MTGWNGLQRLTKANLRLCEQPISVSFGHDGYPSRLVCIRNYYNEFDTEIELMNLDSVQIADGWTTTIRMRTPEKPGPYYIRFCIQSGWLPAYLNSRLMRMDVE